MIFMVVYMSQTAAWPVARFRATLDRILDETDLNQSSLAALVPMDPSQLSRWKSGSSRPKFESLKALGEALRRKYPSLAIGPTELLESAGYAPPEPVFQVSQQEPSDTPEAVSSGARVKRFDDRHLQLEVTVDREESLDELGPLTIDEKALVYTLQEMKKPPETVKGAVRLVRLLDALRAEQEDEQSRREA
jgi:transcriptional regulator with XRE-family HTH domain